MQRRYSPLILAIGLGADTGDGKQAQITFVSKRDGNPEI